ncbi:hypothetical protein HYH03_010352 [Edaphochlamys debaryana]|uniref:Uncharacterized protein n=1 Tax=Edaphochlamys debaryana TaxID=47281 RepID=A0A836BXL9_9CHLO|nr:hypothetical protein HYH03_010352 [Edaphochlamys debaryana]|eukprot:KAG2491353.1 hypothetical protein HYH03_010352 [Edaphochlamys debaryana]
MDHYCSRPAFARYSLSHVVRAQLACEDLRCRYYAGVYLLKHLMLSQQDKYWRSLRHVLGTAQQLNGERLVGREGRRQGMSSRLADVLASAAVSPDPLAPAAPALTLSSAAAAAAATLPAGVASPIAARALLRPLLEALEAACEGSMAPPESGELRQHMETTLAHIGGPSGGPGAPKGAAVAAAWHAFKAVCR